MNWVEILKDCDSNMTPWPRDQSQNSGQVSEDLYYQEYHSSIVQEIKRGCDTCAAIYSMYTIRCSCFCPKLQELSLIYSTLQALQAESCAVFPPCLFFFITSVVIFTFCLHPCSKSRLHHHLLTRSPSMSSKHTRPLQQYPCHTLCLRHR